MENSKNPITGVINTDDVTYCFHLSDYCMLLLDNEVNHSYINATLRPVDGFAQAMTHGGSKILMHVGSHDFTVVNTMKINLSSYIVSTTNVLDYDISYFEGVEFVGGTLLKLKMPMGMKFAYDVDAAKQYIEHVDDSQTFSFSTDDFSCKVTIGSYTSEHHGLTGATLTNGNIYFKMEFDKPQTTSKAYLHYNKVRELLSFLANRCDVGFDEMYLLQKDENHPGMMCRVAQVFIKREKELTKKDIYHNLEFGMLGDSLGNLLRTLYIPKEHSLSIYPESDRRSTIITNDMVRGVCSALECELNFVKGIEAKEAEKIERLVKSIKKVIKEHRKSEDKLEDKTYSLIHGSMSHWSLSASDRIKALFHMYDPEMTILNESRFVISDEEIDAFVKYRNQITHGTYRVLEPVIAGTTHLLAGLVYCCVLTRIGIPREKITQWCEDGRLNN